MEHSAGLDVSVKETSVCIVDETGKIIREVKGCERTRRSAGGADEPSLPLPADRIGSRPVVAVAVQRSRGSWPAGDLRRDAAHASGTEGADQQDRPQ